MRIASRTTGSPETMEEQAIRVLTTSDLAGVAEAAQGELLM
jgi:hypothetical protein